VRLRCSRRRAEGTSRPSAAPARANRPKALSARFTVELGTKTRSKCRAVLVSAKTMPCPNKLASLADTFAAFVHLNRSLLEHNRDTLTLNDRKRQEGVQKCRASDR
jgi:hypothetical protein